MEKDNQKIEAENKAQAGFIPMQEISRLSKANELSPHFSNSDCGTCWGSGWETQFIEPCKKCNGTGKV